MPRADFEHRVRDVLAEIPDEYSRYFENLTFVIEDTASQDIRDEAGLSQGDELLGYFRGFPLNERTHDSLQLEPDMIYLFQRAIEAEAAEVGIPLSRVIRETILHEIAHFFGFSEEDMDRIEALWAGDEA